MEYLENMQANQMAAEEKEKQLIASLSPIDQKGYQLLKYIEHNETELFFDYFNNKLINNDERKYMLLNYRSKHDMNKTLFLACCEYNNIAIFDFLLNLNIDADTNVDVNARDDFDRSGLFCNIIIL